MLTFDNLVLEFQGIKGEPFGSWRKGERKMILRVGRCTKWTLELLFDLCMWTINHEALHGVIDRVCFPYTYRINNEMPLTDWPGKFDSEFVMLSGFDHIVGIREWWTAQIEMGLSGSWKRAREFYHKYVKERQEALK